MKLFNCLVHLDEPKACVVRDIEVTSMEDAPTQGTVSYYGAKHVVEYVGKSPDTLIFTEVKPKEDHKWLL